LSLLRWPSDHHRNIRASPQSARPAIGGIQDQHRMTVFKATPQYEPADRQNRFVSGDSCMRAQRMVRALMELKSPSTTTPPHENNPFLGVRFDVLPSNQSRHEHHQRSDPRRKTPNLHSLE
jgi:hypothetical protein